MNRSFVIIIILLSIVSSKKIFGSVKDSVSTNEQSMGYVNTDGVVDSTIVNLIKLFERENFLIKLNSGESIIAKVKTTANGIILVQRIYTGLTKNKKVEKKVQWKDISDIKIIFKKEKKKPIGFLIGFITTIVCFIAVLNL